MRSKWAAGKARGGRISRAIRNRRARQPPAHFHRNPVGRGQLAVFPHCSLLTYRFRYARRSRLEKQPTDLRRKACLFREQDISACQERSDRKRHECFDDHLDAPTPRHNRSRALRSSDILAFDRTRTAGIWIDCANVFATEMRRFGEIMNKHLSIEEQRAFWTDLFTVTIRYEQAPCSNRDLSGFR